MEYYLTNVLILAAQSIQWEWSHSTGWQTAICQQTPLLIRHKTCEESNTSYKNDNRCNRAISVGVVPLKLLKYNELLTDTTHPKLVSNGVKLSYQ